MVLMWLNNPGWVHVFLILMTYVCWGHLRPVRLFLCNHRRVIMNLLVFVTISTIMLSHAKLSYFYKMSDSIFYGANPQLALTVVVDLDLLLVVL